ncbi:hypothetical protein ACFL6R_03395 [Gemmatimonadota bacterium]
MPAEALESHIAHLIEMLDLDGFEVNPRRYQDSYRVDDPDQKKLHLKVDPLQDVFILETPEGTGLGIRAHHKTATNYQTGERKRAFYLEGSPWQRGFLVGLMAHQSVKRMAVDFVDNLSSSMLSPDNPSKFLLIIIDLIVRLLFPKWIREIKKDIEPEALDMFESEIDGIWKGCRAVDRLTEVRTWRLWSINAGFDGLLAHAYTRILPGKGGNHPLDRPVSAMCNGFVMMGDITGGRHFIGRDQQLKQESQTSTRPV